MDMVSVAPWKVLGGSENGDAVYSLGWSHIKRLMVVSVV